MGDLIGACICRLTSGLGVDGAEFHSAAFLGGILIVPYVTSRASGQNMNIGHMIFEDRLDNDNLSSEVKRQRPASLFTFSHWSCFENVYTRQSRDTVQIVHANSEFMPRLE